MVLPAVQVYYVIGVEPQAGVITVIDGGFLPALKGFQTVQLWRRVGENPGGGRGLTGLYVLG